jgi:hypothetical protein
MKRWKRAPWVSSGAESILWVFVVLLLVAVVRRVEAVGNYLPRYIEKVATDVIRRAWNLR